MGSPAPAVTEKSDGRDASVSLAWRPSVRDILELQDGTSEQVSELQELIAEARAVERLERDFYEDMPKGLRKRTRVNGLPANLVTTRELIKASGLSASTLGRLTRSGVIAPSPYTVKSGGRGRPEKTWPLTETLAAITNPHTGRST